MDRTSYVIRSHSGEYWDLSPPLWKSLQFIPGWCKSTYILVSIQYSCSTWCHHKSYEALIYYSGHYTWPSGLVWLSRGRVRCLVILEMIHHILVGKIHGNDIDTWHECGSCDSVCIRYKWMIISCIHSTTRWICIYTWKNKLVSSNDDKWDTGDRRYYTSVGWRSMVNIC